MPKLKKLLIQGIRSFNPKKENVIEFISPLTLIVGANGTGKTTIIECLKFATTGDMPPNSRGGAFVYDPKLARQIDVKAEVRLEFQNTKNEHLVCSRTIQASVKKSKAEQKTLECSLSKEIDNQIVLINSKIGDIDKLVPENLGINHSILDNVIFCHQDESTWPIGDPTVMKKKLDDIFSSTKYNKALLGFKATKKEISADLKLKTQQLSFFLKEKLKRDEITKKIANQTEEVERKNFKIKTLSNEIDQLNFKLEKMTDECRIFEKLENNHRILKTEYESCLNFIKNFSYPILNEFDTAKLSEKISNLEIELDELNSNRIEEDFKNVENLRSKIVEQELQNEKYNEKIKDLENKIKTFGEEKENLFSNLCKELDCSRNEIKEKAQKLIEKIEKDVKEKTEELNRKREELLSLKSAQNRHSSSIEESRNFIQKYKNLKPQTDLDLTEISIDYDKQIELEVVLDELLENLSSKQALLTSILSNSDIHFKRKHLVESIENLKNLIQIPSDEFKRRIDGEKANQNEIRGKLKLIYPVHQKNLVLNEQRQAMNSKIVNEIIELQENIKNEYLNDDLSILFEKLKEKITGTKKATAERVVDNKTVTVSRKDKFEKAINIKKDIPERILDIKNVDPKTVTTSRKDIFEREVNIKKATPERIADKVTNENITEVKDFNPEFEKITSEMIVEIKKLFSGKILEIQEIPDITAIESEISKINEKIGTFSAASKFYANFLQIGNTKEHCPLCIRAFDQNTKREFEIKMNGVLEKIPCTLDELDKKKKDLEKQKYKNDQILTINNCKMKIKNLLNELSDYELLYNTEIRELEIQKENSEINLLKLSEKYKEVLSAESSIGKLRNELSQIPEQTNAKAIEDEIKDLKNKIDLKRNELSSYSKLIKENEFKRKIIQEEIENRKIIEKRDLLIKELENMKIVDLTDLEREVSILEKNREDANQEMIQLKMVIKMKIKRIEEIKNVLIKFENEKMNLNSKIIDLYSEKTVKFNNLILKSEDLKLPEKYEELRKMVLNHKNEIIKTVKELEKSKTELKIADENIKLRKNKEKIKILEDEFSKFDIKAYKQLKMDIETYEMKKSKLISAESQVRGELKQIVSTIKSLNLELDEYKDTNRNYLRCSIEIKILEFSLEDLDKCISGLDKAIVDFHSSKIEEVNRSLKDLWMNTYKGNDIDFIELKSESSDTRAYNYRLVMIKNGIELDMRGRSSAGQKMISSLLFRIALADSFSSGFNIFGLDEPTTNLDRENIESLASTLSSIIKNRKNTQFIVITHDEEFVQLLNREGTEYFYRIDRDSKGNSHIQRHSIYK